MARNYTFKFIKFEDKAEKIGCFLIVAIISFSFIFLPIYIFFQFPEDNSAEFIFEYDTPDLDFGTIDYSGIEYFIDGVPYFTDASGIVHFVINDEELHTFSCLFGGVLYEYTFDASTQQYVTLATKDISSIILYDTVFTLADDVLVDLYFHTGTEWILIETISTDLTGLASFTGLIMGSYLIVESGLFVEANIFALEQDTIIYTTGVLIPPKETVIDIEYLNTIFGADYPVDLSTITFSLWIQGTAFDELLHSDGVAYNNAEGQIIIYNLYEVAVPDLWHIEITYAGAIQSFDIAYHTLTAIDLVAKSGEFEFLWSSDSAPVQNRNFELFWFDGVDWISAGMYMTDVDGKIIIDSLLIIGQYKFDDYAIFTVVSSDVVVIEQFSVESISKIISIFREKGSFTYQYIWEMYW